MNKLWNLTLIALKASGAFGTGGRRRDGRTKKAGPFAIVGLIFGLLAAGAAMGFSYYFLLVNARDGNFLTEYTKILALYSFIFVLGFSINFTMAFFFLSTDNDVYLPLPLKPSEIFFARYIANLVSTYMVQLIFVFPIIVVYDIVATPSFIAYISQLLLLIANPIIVSGLIFLIDLLIARVFNISKHRKLATALIMVVMMVTIIAGSMLPRMLSVAIEVDPATGLPTQASIDATRAAIATVTKMTNFLIWYRDPFAIAMAGDTPISIVYALLFVGVALVIFLLSFGAAELFYAKTIVGSSETRSRYKKQALSVELAERKIESSFTALVAKERRTLFRSFTYFSQLVLPIFIMLIVAIVSAIVPLMTGESAFVSYDQAQFAAVGQSLTNIDAGAYMLIFIAITAFLSSMTTISSTAISREGANAYTLKIFPINPLEQVGAKIFWGVLIDSCLIVPLLIVGSIIFQFNWLYALVTTIASVLVIILINVLMLLIDLRRPMLHWTNEIVVTKQNLNTFFGILIGWGMAIIFGGLGAIMFAIPAYSALIAGAIALLVPTITLMIIYRKIKKAGSAIYKHVE